MKEKNLKNIKIEFWDDFIFWKKEIFDFLLNDILFEKIDAFINIKTFEIKFPLMNWKFKGKITL